MHRTHHRTLEHWDSPFNFSLRRDVLSQKLELVHLQLGDLVLQLAELARHHVTLERHHRHRAGHDLLAVVFQKVASELHPKVRNHGEGPY